ncbi:MAG: FAD-dependent oxidoreductase [Planctomycetota bacterium]
MRIAIIGTGVSGLVAAYRLHQDHDISLFEASDYLGGHANTVTVEAGSETHAVDTGFVVFNEWCYPNFISLLDELGIGSKPTCMSFSVRDEYTGLEYNGHSLNTLFAQRRNLLRPAFHRMLYDILRFNKDAKELLRSKTNETVGEFITRLGYGPEFSRHYLLPMGSAIWSCPLGTFAHFPIRFIAEFYENHGLLNLRNRPTWRVVKGGSRTYVEAISRGFRDRVRLSTPVVKIYRFHDCVHVHPEHGLPEQFDHVIFACHSDQALRILGDAATPTERQLLTAFPYEKNSAVLHTDVSLLPRNRRAWASWNYRVGKDEWAPATVTYNMNLLQGIRSPQTYCVTLNDDDRINPERVIRRFVYHHPVFTVARDAAQARHHELLVDNRTSFCGAYWRNGFHEDGVVSALAVVDALKSLSRDRRRSAANQIDSVPHMVTTKP